MPFFAKQKTIITIAFFCLILDRLAKMAAIKIWAGHEIIITPWLKLTLNVNRNIAFSLPLTGAVLNVILAIILLNLAYYCLYFYKQKQSRPAMLLTIIFISATLNFLDRLFYGGVIDYIGVKNFTILNLTDIIICLSSLALAIYFVKNSSLRNN